jgi:hypothetical protein
MWDWSVGRMNLVAGMNENTGHGSLEVLFRKAELG